MTDVPIDTEAQAAGTRFAGRAPAQRFSSPDVVDWHMILDHELDQLSQLETGILGSVGFVALGAAIGLLPSFVSTLEIAGAGLANGDLATIIAFVLSCGVATVCLLLFGASALRNRGLKDQIRNRPKYGFGGEAPAADESSA